MNLIKHIIGGRESVDESSKRQAVFNPATGEQIAEVMLAGSHEINLAVQAASQAFESWSQVTPAQRARLMFSLHSVMGKHQDQIAETISAEHGKTHLDALGEVARALEVVEFAAGIPSHLSGSFSGDVAVNVDSFSERQPLGVVAGITPFNFPTMVPLWMIPMAIACGNAFVLKPSERDPSSANMIHRIMVEAGFPAELLTIVHGGKEAVDAVLDHPGIQAVSFVGSTAIAEYVYKRGCASGKRVQALGGAKNHMVIMPDADIEQAADAVMGAAFGSAGERCMSISVAVPVGQETADKLVTELAARLQDLQVGPSTQDNSEMGPVITQEARERIIACINAGEAEGAKVVVDGRAIDIEGCENGFWVGATLLDHVSADMSVYTTEIFGPVLSVLRAESYEQAINLINDHEYGNGTAIFTRDGDAARDFTKRVKIGMVGVNVPIPVPVAFHSFGGWKRSLFGSHGIYGPEAVQFYTRLKTVTARWPTGIRAGAEFNFPSTD